MPQTLADRIIAFNASLNFSQPLPTGIRVMNPFRENASALAASSAFYQKYYADHTPRRMILGINPGRFGAGLTGVPFTDPKRLKDICGIASYSGPPAHEPSSVFIYDMIARYGGPERFYEKFYINSICPLGFTASKKNDREVNCNYYDDPALAEVVLPFAISCIKRQIDFGMLADVCFCLGMGKNVRYLRKINEEHHIFGRIIPLEHPRYIIQYKSKKLPEYIDKYLEAFNSVD